MPSDLNRLNIIVIAAYTINSTVYYYIVVEIVFAIFGVK